MNLLVISDLHIGNNDHFETFGWRPSNFIKALEKVTKEEKIDKIVLNGDVFELYKYSFQEICRNNAELTEYLLHHPNIIYIKGNHDAICPFGEENITFTNSRGQKIYIEHGHSADFMNGTRLGRKIQTLGFNLLRWVSNMSWVLSTYLRIHEMHEAINKIPKRYDSIRYLSHALRLLKNNDLVLLGHTHKIEAHKTYYLNTKKHYVNSGSCSMGRFQGVIVDTETMKYETLKFKNYKELKKFYQKETVRELALSA
ncbi:MAG: metallophosphoesterase [Bacteroidota bacterium]